MDNKKWYKNPEMIVGLSALLIGVVTAFTSVYSAYVDREYARASVWPRLEIFRSFDGHSIFQYGVANNGTGPAIIRYAKVQYQQDYIKKWSDINSIENFSFSQSHISNRTLPAQQKILPLSYKGENFMELLKADKSITIELCYCSIYNECWVIDRGNRPESVEACEIDEKHAFLQ